MSCTEGNTDTQLEPMVECLISNQCVGFYDPIPPCGVEGMGVCIIQNDCLQFDDEGGLDVIALRNCLLRYPIVNPNPPCGDFLDTVGALACVTACEVGQGDAQCIVGCLVQSGTFIPGIQKILDCTMGDGVCAPLYQGGVREIVECLGGLEEPLADPAALFGCLVKFDPTPFKAIYRDGIGCTLVDGVSEEELRAQPLGNVNNPPFKDDSLPWPLGEAFEPVIEDGIDMECIQRVADEQFADGEANPRAITVVHKGSLIFEQYADSVDKDSPLIGWCVIVAATVLTFTYPNAFYPFLPSPFRPLTYKLPAHSQVCNQVNHERAHRHFTRTWWMGYLRQSPSARMGERRQVRNHHGRDASDEQWYPLDA